ncbi:major facilitator superfamily transporter 3 isoform 2-T2 [Glossina fuscipes fuscipes]
MVKDIPARGTICGKCLPARYVLAVLGSIGMAIIYGLKVNLSVAMVAMLNHTAIRNDNVDLSHNINDNFAKPVEKCQPPDGDTDDYIAILEDGPFDWSGPLQGTLLSCYFWGYLISQIPGARIAENFSAKWVMLSAVAINVFCTILTPIFTKVHYVGLIFMRVLEGIGGGVTFPAMHCTSFGTAVSILMAGFLSDNFGWESIFYVMGGLSCIWMILWICFVQDNPNEQRFITADEREMINSSLGQSKEDAKEGHPPTPWNQVLTSIPFWAILIAHCCSNWGWYMFLIEVPFYMKQVLALNVTSNAMASAMPYFPLLIFSIMLGKILDTLKAKEKITTTAARKISTTIASAIPMLCLLILCYIGCRHTWAVAIMTIGIISMGAMFSGFLSNHIDIAPNFSGTLVALTNTVATLPGIIVPIFVGFITKGNQTIAAWRIIFFVTMVLFVIEFLVYIILGSGEEQPWNKKNQTNDSENTPLRNKENTS